MRFQAAVIELAKRLFSFPVALLLVVAATASVQGQDEAARKQRLDLMQRTIAGFEVSSDEIRSKPALQFAEQPLLRYSDPTRDLMDASTLLDAGVWRLGREGRPTALVTLEIYRSPEGAVLAYEFLSLFASKFSLVHTSAEKVAWDATGTDLKLTPFDKAPPPAKSAGARLTQMRELARRFVVRERLNESDIECRLLARPIDRYESAKDKVLDGALFAFANGTNPEAGLILECDEKEWRYGTVRLGAAQMAIQLDGREVASYPFFGQYGLREAAYTSTSHAIDLPK